MGAELLAAVRPMSVWDAVDAAAQESLPVVVLLLVAALAVWPLALLLRRRRR